MSGFSFSLSALSAFAALFGILFLHWSIHAFYNINFHPLRKYPARKLWAASRLPFVYAMIRGRYVHEVRDMHRHYGPIVRIAPNELSFASPSAWPVLHQRSGARNPFLKNPVFVIKPQNHPVESIPTTTSTEDHERMRGVLEKSFTRGSISLQEPIVQRNIDLMVKQLRDLVDKSGRAGATVDMTDWFSHCAFDVIGDLAFGESFGCLEHGKSHKWVAICTNYIKTLTFATALKYYPWFETFLKRAIPMALLSEIEAKERYHYDHTVHMVKKRLGLEKKKEDIMTAIIEHVGKKNHMAFDEICCNFGFLIVAGSETTTVTLSGILHHLIAAPEVLARLEKEVCGRFQCDTQIVSAVLEKMPYLNAVTHEGLRMCSPVPAGNSRIVPPGGAIVCGEHIPAGTHVALHPFTLHYSADHFSSPDVFIPERWIVPRPNVSGITTRLRRNR